MKLIIKLTILTLLFTTSSAFAEGASGGGPILLQHASLIQRDSTTPVEFDFSDQFAGLTDITTEDFATAANPITNPFVNVGIEMIESGNIDGFKVLAAEVNGALGISGAVAPETFMANVEVVSSFGSEGIESSTFFGGESPELNAAAFAKMVSAVDFNTSEQNAASVGFEPVSFQDSYEKIEVLYLEALDSL